MIRYRRTLRRRWQQQHRQPASARTPRHKAPLERVRWRDNKYNAVSIALLLYQADITDIKVELVDGIDPEMAVVLNNSRVFLFSALMTVI